MKRSILAVVLLLLAVLLLVSFWPEDPAPPASGSGAEAAAEENTPLVAPTPKQDAGSAAAPNRIERRSLPKPAVDSGLAVFRGRCVDEGGAPQAGVEVRLHAWTGNSQRMAQYRKDHGEVEWTDPENQETSADGRFEFRFAPPPPYQITLDMTQTGRVTMTGRWGSVAPGEIKDFGDVTMAVGCLVRGRVEDTEGLPIAEARVYVNRHNDPAYAPKTEIYYSRSTQVRAGADGSFTLRNLLPAGPWKLSIPHKTLVKPKSLVVPANQVETFATLVVRSEKDVPSIRGMVVDELGAPVAGARLSGGRSRSGIHWTESSKRDGTFVIRNPAGSGAPVLVGAEREGYEQGKTEKPVAWGTEGVRIVLRRGLDIQVRVTDAATGKPVLDYGVIAMPTPGRWQTSSSLDSRVRSRGKHSDGLVTVSGLRRGPYLLLVDPTGDDYLHSGYQPFEVRDGGPETFEFKLSKGVERTLKVETGAGEPVVGTEVELVEPTGDTVVDFKTWVFKLHSGSHSSTLNRALLWQKAKTDAEGRIRLRAPARSGYALRILGPGHQPQVEQPVDLAAGAAPLVVRVASGASLVGQIGPARLVEQLHGPLSAGSDRRPGVILRPLIQGSGPSYPADHLERFLIDEEGRFEITGIKPGNWKLLLRWNLNGKEVAQDVLDLKEGETRKLQLALPQLVFARVRGRVSHNGKPMSGGNLTLKVEMAANQISRWENAPIDDQGNFEIFAVPDDYQLILQLKEDRRWSTIPASGRLLLQPGADVKRDFEFRSRLARLEVVGLDGKPRAGVSLRIGGSGPSDALWLQGTDPKGLGQLRMPLASQKIHIWPKAMMEPAARQKFWTEHADDPGAWERSAISVGVIPAGSADTEVRVELPASAGY